MQIEMDEKVVVVSGAGSGLGKCIAKQAGAAGAKIVGVDLFDDRLEALAAEAKAEGWELHPKVVDFGDGGAVASLITEVHEELGRLDVLVNNAAIGDAWAPAGDISDETYHRVMAVNVFGPFSAIRQALPLMLAAGGGTIVNIASIAAWKGYNGGAIYSASKAALASLSKSVACAYGDQGIRSFAICPGGMDTRIREADPRNPLGTELMERQGGTRPPLSDPNDVASVAVMLMSDGAVALNGALVPVDRGWSAW